MSDDLCLLGLSVPSTHTLRNPISTASSVASELSKPPIHLESLSYDPISCYRKPVERTTEIKGCAISSVPSAGFPVVTDRIVGLSLKVDGGLKA